MVVKPGREKRIFKAKTKNKYGTRSPKFNLAPVYTAGLIGSDPATSAPLPPHLGSYEGVIGKPR